MSRITCERGTTLIEALVAAGLLITLLAGVAQLFTGSRLLARRAALVSAAAIVAGDRLERFRALAWTWDPSGTPVEEAGLALSPPGALEADTPGFADRVDVSGRASDHPAAGAPVFARRWSVVSAGDDEPEARTIEVCVFTLPAAAGAPPLACLATIRTRQP